MGLFGAIGRGIGSIFGSGTGAQSRTPAPDQAGPAPADSSPPPERASGKGAYGSSMLGNTASAYADDLSAFLHGQQRGVQSSNVMAGQYNPDEHYLQLGYKNGGWYGYHDVSPQEAASFYSAGSKGKWVWDHLRVRGTVFGYQKPYAFIGGRSQEYQPKYYENDTHREEHRRIAPSGHLPASWLGGKGPYDQKWATASAPHPHDEQSPMTGASPHPRAEKNPMGQLSADETAAITHRKVPMAYHAPAEDIPVAKPAPPEAGSPKAAKSGGGFWGWLGKAASGVFGSIFGRGQHKAAGGEVEQRLGDGGDNEPIMATPGEYVETRQERNHIDSLLGRDSSRTGGANGHFAKGGQVKDLTTALGAHKIGGIIGDLVGQFAGPSAGSLGGSMAAGGMVGGAEGAMAAGGGPIGVVVAGAKAINDQFDKLAGGLGDANKATVDFATGFATTLGVPKSIAELGGSILGVVSPLKGLEIGVKAAQFAMMPILNLDKPGEIVKDVFKSIADVGNKVVTALLDMRDPAAMFNQAVGPFIGQVSKFNPGTVERFHLALDNLSAAAGVIFEPIIEIGREFADELNVLYTSVQSELQPVIGDVAGLLRDTLREPIVMLVGIVREGAPIVRGLMTDLAPMGSMVRTVTGYFGTLASGALQTVGNWFSVLGPIVGSAVEHLQPLVAIGTEVTRALFELGSAGWEIGRAFYEIVRPILGSGPVFQTLVSSLRTTAASFSTAAGVVQDFAGQITWVIGKVRHALPAAMGGGGPDPGARPEMRDPRQLFRDAMERMQNAGQGAGPNQGPMSVAAQPARFVGIEQVGQDARQAAFSQGVSIQQQQLDVANQQLQALRQMLDALRAAGLPVPALPPGVM